MSAAGALRCAAVARAEGLEPLGTAGDHAGYLLVDWPLPWPADVGDIAELAPVHEAAAAAGVRVQAVGPASPDESDVVLYRRDRPAAAGFAGYARTAVRARRPHVVAAALALLAGEATTPPDETGPTGAPAPTGATGPTGATDAAGPAWGPVPGDVRGDVLVCGHGRRDPCCGREGTLLTIELLTDPDLSGAMHAAGYRVGRTSHTGGHRFAPTGIVLPEATMWAFLDGATVARVVGRTGPVSAVLPHYRGSAALGTPALQAVERVAFGEVGWDWLDWRRRGHDRGDGSVVLEAESPDGRRAVWEAVVGTRTRPVPDCGRPIGESRKESVEPVVASVTRRHCVDAADMVGPSNAIWRALDPPASRGPIIRNSLENSIPGGHMDRYLVISADGHAGPPPTVYREYLDPAFREAFDTHQAELEAGRMVNTEFVEEWDEETGDHDMKAGYDPTVRDGILDQEGVAAEVLFPDADVLGTGRLASSPFGSGLGSGAGADPDAVKAGARAHNRWLADFCRTNPHRRIGVAVVPVTAGVDDAVAEVRAAAENGLRGVMIPTRWFDAPAYIDPSYEPFWAACAEAGMVLHTHSGAGPADYTMGPGFLSIYAAEAWWWAARPFWVLVLSGVFARHPELRYSIAENGAWWVPDLVTRMDEKWEGAHNTRKFGDAFKLDLPEAPSAYVNENCFFAASTPGADEITRRHAIGVGNLLWGNDLPHPEGTYPHTRKWIAERFRAVPQDETAAILGTNAAAVYKVDVDALREVSDRIGPTPADVHG